MRVVHLARDEKFIPLVRELFEEALPGANRWVIARRRRARQRFVDPAANVVFRSETWFRLPWIGGDVAQADVILAHSMSSIFANAIAKAPAHVRVAWKGWGYDYYPLLARVLGDPLLPATRALVSQGCHAEADAAGSGGRGFWPPLLRKTPALERIAARLHSISVLPTEVEALRRALPALQAVQHEMPLFTAEDTFCAGPRTMDGPDVLLGNSATASNNHADAMALLRQRLGDGRLIVPLSYGDAGYATKIESLGRQQFGERFNALRQWMSLVDYNQRIQRCGFVVMNHRRQQAVGNIGAALYKGATVYLRPENPLFAHYTGLGLSVRDLQALADGQGPLVALSAVERQNNHRIIARHYARERVVAAMRSLPALHFPPSA
jgi:hypothetical protein